MPRTRRQQAATTVTPAGAVDGDLLMSLDPTGSFVDPNQLSHLGNLSSTVSHSHTDPEYLPAEQATGMMGAEDSNDTLNTSEDGASVATGTSTVTSARPGPGRPRGRGRPAGRKSGQMDPAAQKALFGDVAEDDNTLFQALSGRGALLSVVDEWIESYRQDRDNATLELMNFFIRSSGCRGKITRELRQTHDNAQLIKEMTDEFDEDAGAEYPLIMTGPHIKKFKTNFGEMIHLLIRQCQYSIIYDQYLMESIIGLLICMSDSQVRAFRHTSTLAAMRLMTSLVDVALTLSINMDNTQRQYETERGKSGGGRRGSSDRLEMLMSKKQELEENMDDIKTMLGYLFKSIFVHRYRDSIPEIRGLCMTEIGVWMKRFPNHYLDDSYLKYVGWTLHDKVSDVRLKCLQALLPLYDSEEIAHKMELFTNKFKQRIVAMTLDKDYDVAVHAIKLIISIHKHHQEILTDKDCEHVYELVYATHRSVAQAAGEFLNERLFQVDENAPEVRSRRGKKRSIHTPHIRDLVLFFIESELHDHGAYLVDSLIETHPMIKDWECYTDLLWEEPGTDEDPLDDKQESSLIEIMVCAVRQAATGEAPVGRGPARKQLTAKEQKIIADDRQAISEHFIVALPPLIDKYKTDQEKVANLLQVPQFFELTAIAQHQTHVKRLLDLVSAVCEIHNEQEVLEAAARTFEVLYDEEYQFSREVKLALGSVVDQMVDAYQTASDAYTANPAGQDEALETTVAIHKLAIFYSTHDLSSRELWDDMFQKWIRTSNLPGEQELIPVGAVRHAITACHMGLVWRLHDLSSTRSAATETAQEVKQNLHDFMAELRTLLRHPVEQVQEEAYISLCDLLVIFSHQLENDSPAVALLAYEPSKQLLLDLESFVAQRVFVEPTEEETARIDVLHQRRHWLAAYCKLIVYNIAPIRHAACIIKHYVRYFNDYGDIIKTTLGKAREINKVLCARTMAAALISVFRELLRVVQSLEQGTQAAQQAFTKQDEQFSSLKELAKRFALSFGLDNMKNRDAVATLHREGIQFTFGTIENPLDPLGPPPHLPFLEVLSEFSNKLIKQDKKTVLAYLDKCVRQSLPGIHQDEWPPLMSYRSSLTQHNEFDIPSTRAGPNRQYKGRKRGRDDEEEEGEEQSELGSEMAE